MKVIIAGGRYINNYQVVKQVIEDSNFNITKIISGTCSGVDLLGERWAKENHIPIERFLPYWKSFGKSAGPMRNNKMIIEGKAEGLILIWDGKSKGSRDMKSQAKKYNLIIYEKII